MDTPAGVLVAMNDPAANAAMKFPSNFIKTSKYNILTFLPLNLLHQFRRVSNFYFLVNMVFALIPGVSPVSPYTAVLPLMFVIGVALVKDAFEEYKRHKNDYIANNIHAKVLRQDKATDQWELQELPSKDVCVGDIIRIELGEEIRADVLLLSSSITEAQAFIDTCNLDGETNLKNRRGTESTWHLNTVESLTSCKLTIHTSEPDPGLLHWTGVLKLDGKETAVGLDQFLYRSAVLRNTDWIWGVVVYAGVDTKMFRNLAEKPPKMSSLDYKLNNLIIAVLIVQNILLIIMASWGTWFAENQRAHWYARRQMEAQTGGELWWYRYLTYFILMSYLIPISLFVTIELCKVMQARLMEWDKDMFIYMNEKMVHCRSNSSDLNEQLSQVKFIFTDKTGTLTENIMTYKRGDALGIPIAADDDYENSLEELRKPGSDGANKIGKYMRALSLCHTIQPFEDKHHPGKLRYEGASPDEVALVEAAAIHGFVLLERSTRTMTVEERGKAIKYDILATLEFTPDRKMMSIIVRHPETKDITLFTKGADSFVLPNLLQGAPNTQYLGSTNENLKMMADLGLRTLMVCTKTLSEEEFSKWYAEFEEAGKCLENRSAVVDEVCLKMESSMILVGGTAIEDKLQMNVPETLEFFLDAGVIVWMLTGDKRETAVTIAATSSLANPQNDAIIHIDIGELTMRSTEAIELVHQQLSEVNDAIAQGTRKVTFVVDGPALNVAMNNHFDFFLDISQRVNSAVCCRLTPLQKANVVKMFQTATGATALAIGDGANDVSMIQEGRVGVGIVGLEGAQAALAADYAIPRFMHLRRLCAVHGRYALVRNGICISVSFYKNVLLSMTQFYFGFYTGFSGQTMYDGWLLAFYNFAFTSLPPLFMGFFEKDIEESMLMRHPNLYPPLGKGAYFNPVSMLRWFGEAIVHSLILFWVAFPSQKMQDLGSGRTTDLLMFGTIVISSMIVLVLGKMALHMRYWQVIEVVGLVLSAVFYVVFLFCYASIPNLFGDSTFYYTTFILFQDAKYWLYMLFFVMGLLIPIDLSVIFLQKQLAPTVRDEAEELYFNELQ